MLFHCLESIDRPSMTMSSEDGDKVWLAFLKNDFLQFFLAIFWWQTLFDIRNYRASRRTALPTYAYMKEVLWPHGLQAIGWQSTVTKWVNDGKDRFLMFSITFCQKSAESIPKVFSIVNGKDNLILHRFN